MRLSIRIENPRAQFSIFVKLTRRVDLVSSSCDLVRRVIAIASFPLVNLCDYRCIYCVIQVRFSSDRELMLKYAGTGRKLSIVSATSMYIAGFIYHTILPFCTEHKVNNETIRPLVYPTYSKFGQTQTSPTYELVYLAHCLCGYTMYTVTAGSCGLAAIFATHACGQIEVISSRLEDLSHGENYERIPDVNQRIAAIVKSHVRVLR